MSNEYDCPEQPGGHEWVNDLRTDLQLACLNCKQTYNSVWTKKRLSQ